MGVEVSSSGQRQAPVRLPRANDPATN